MAGFAGANALPTTPMHQSYTGYTKEEYKPFGINAREWRYGGDDIPNSDFFDRPLPVQRSMQDQARSSASSRDSAYSADGVTVVDRPAPTEPACSWWPFSSWWSS